MGKDEEKEKFFLCWAQQWSWAKTLGCLILRFSYLFIFPYFLNKNDLSEVLKTSLSNYQPLRDVSRFLKMLPFNQNWAGQIPNNRKGWVILYANSNTDWDLIPWWAVLVFFSNSVSTQMCHIRGHKLCPSHSLACVQWFFWIWRNILKQETSPKTQESRETWQQDASNLRGLWSVGTPRLLRSVAGQPEPPSAMVPATNVHVQHVTPTPAGVLLLPEGTGPLPAGTSSKQKVQTFCFFHYGTFHYNRKERMCTYMECKLGTAYIEKKVNLWEESGLSVFKMNRKPTKFSWSTN